MKNKILLLLIASLTTVLLSACAKEDLKTQGKDAESATTPIAQEALSLDAEAAKIWWLYGGEILARCLHNARELQQLTSDFLDEPNSKKLAAAQYAWRQTLAAYNSFYAHHYVALIEPRVFDLLAEIDFRVAAWPIQPGSLDSFGPYLYSGLVHDIGNPLTMENLLALHGQIDSENATLGLFTIEYMLFGENASRSIDDYTRQVLVTPAYKERGFNSPSELPNNRRRMLLTLQAGKLVDDLELLVRSWSAPGAASQLEAWNTLPAPQKSQIIAAVLERGLAQLLANEDKQRGTEQLLAILQSLVPLPALIKHANQQKMEQEFATLSAVLQTEQEDVAEDAAAPNWSEVVAHLTTLSKLFAPSEARVPPEENVSSDS